MTFQHVRKQKSQSLNSVSSNRRIKVALKISLTRTLRSNHIITTCPFCFLHKSGGLSVLQRSAPRAKRSPQSQLLLFAPSFPFQLPQPLFPPPSCQLFHRCCSGVSRFNSKAGGGGGGVGGVGRGRVGIKKTKQKKKLPSPRCLVDDRRLLFLFLSFFLCFFSLVSSFFIIFFPPVVLISV